MLSSESAVASNRVSSAASSGLSRPLLLRADVAWVPGRIEVGNHDPMARSACATAGVRSVADVAEEEKLYVLPPGVMGRIAVRSSLSSAHRRGGIKRCRGVKVVDPEDAANVAGKSSASRRDDDGGDGDEGEAGGGSLSA